MASSDRLADAPGFGDGGYAASTKFSPWIAIGTAIVPGVVGYFVSGQHWWGVVASLVVTAPLVYREVTAWVTWGSSGVRFRNVVRTYEYQWSEVRAIRDHRRWYALPGRYTRPSDYSIALQTSRHRWKTPIIAISEARFIPKMDGFFATAAAHGIEIELHEMKVAQDIRNQPVHVDPDYRPPTSDGTF